MIFLSATVNIEGERHSDRAAQRRRGICFRIFIIHNEISSRPPVRETECKIKGILSQKNTSNINPDFRLSLTRAYAKNKDE